MNVLGWEKITIDVERRENGEYSDYELGKPQKYCVVEAKRENINFNIPNSDNKKLYKISTLMEDSHVAAAIQQACRYSQYRGIPNAIVTNGWQYIAFISSRTDGIPPLDGNAIVFDGFEEMVENFRFLWDSISQYAIQKNNLYFSVKAKDLTTRIPPKASFSITGYPRPINRSMFGTEYAGLAYFLMEDLASQEDIVQEILEKAYCQSGLLSDYLITAQSLLKYTSNFEIEIDARATPAETKKGLDENLKKHIDNKKIDDEIYLKHPILLVGNVGVGKTMFINRLIKVQAKDELKNSYVIYINFGKEPADKEGITNFIINKITEDLDSKYNIDIQSWKFVYSLYYLEIMKLKNTVEGHLLKDNPNEFNKYLADQLIILTSNKENHIKKCIQFFRSNHKKNTVVFLDNVDQRNFDFQQDIFMVAQVMASSWGAVTFVTLRPDTLIKSKKKGSLSAYNNRIFTISPPRIEDAVTKRLDFAILKLRNDRRFSSFPEFLNLDSPTYIKFIEILSHAIKTDRSITSSIVNISNENIRKALEITINFISSPHLNTDKIINILRRDSRYNIPFHEWNRSLLFRDREHYDPTVSSIINLFDISASDIKEHFLLSILLSIIINNSKEGVIEFSYIYSVLQSLGFSLDQIKRCIDRSLENNCTRFPLEDSWKDVSDFISITPYGAYLIKELILHFSYIDAISIDIPICLPQFRNIIKDESNIKFRLIRAKNVLDYLDEAWKELPSITSEIFDWPNIRNKIFKTIESIQNRNINK